MSRPGHQPGEPKVWIDLSNSPHPLLFAPIARRIEELGGTVAVTYRDHAQTAELARERWPGATLVAEAGRGPKLTALTARAARLARWAWRERPQVALSHNSYAQLVAARALRIPAVTAMDFEHQPANGIAFRAANRILLPDAVPAEVVERQGAKPRKVRRYDGLKEEVYLADFQPDPAILERLGVSRPEGGAVVVARSAPMGAAYHPEENPILEECLRTLDRRSDVVTVMLARLDSQRERLRSLGLERVVVPEGAVDARSLLYVADAFVGAGGTMSREAALLGVPSWSAFAGERPAVDGWLEERGMLRPLRDPEELATVGPRESRSADLARIAAAGERIRKVFVDAVFELARRTGDTD